MSLKVCTPLLRKMRGVLHSQRIRYFAWNETMRARSTSLRNIHAIQKSTTSPRSCVPACHLHQVRTRFGIQRTVAARTGSQRLGFGSAHLPPPLIAHHTLLAAYTDTSATRSAGPLSWLGGSAPPMCRGVPCHPPAHGWCSTQQHIGTGYTVHSGRIPRCSTYCGPWCSREPAQPRASADAGSAALQLAGWLAGRQGASGANSKPVLWCRQTRRKWITPHGLQLQPRAALRGIG